MKYHFIITNSFFVSICLLISIEITHAQNVIRINGRILNEEKKAIEHANVVIKAKNGEILNFKNSDIDGNYFIDINTKSTELIIEVTCLGYQKNIHEFLIPESVKIFKLDFFMKTSLLSLPEVNIISKAPPITVKNDTTVFKVKSFITGNEDVVEDVLKKLPGVEVDDNGKIKFKGKPISKVLVEGNDLLSKNYQIGTKNLSSTILNEVEAIENYVENKNLKGFQKTNETVLNLKVHEDIKNKPNLSLSLGYGYKNQYDFDKVLLGVNKKFSYYLLSKANNIGTNPSQYDNFSFEDNSETKSDFINNQDKIITSDYSLPIINSKRGNINRSVFTSGNTTYKPNEKLNITANYTLYKDKLSLNTSNNTKYNLNLDSVSFVENKTIIKKPLLGQTLVSVLYDLSKKSNLKYNSNFSIGKIQHSDDLNANYGSFINNLKDKNNSYHQDFEYVNRISDNSVLKVNSSQFIGSQPQYFTISPSLDLINLGLKLNSQDIKQSTRVFDLRSTYIHKSKNYFKTFIVQYNKNQGNLQTRQFTNRLDNNLTKNEHKFILGYLNDFEAKKMKLSIGLLYKIKSIETINFDTTSLSNKLNYLAPKVNFTYNPNNKNKFNIEYSFDQFLPEITDLYQGFVLIDENTLNKGFSNLNNFKRISLGSSYIHNDLFNQFLFLLYFNYAKNSATFGNYLNVDPRFVFTQRSIFPGTENYSVISAINKYIPFISSTVKYTQNLFWNEFYNRLNGVIDTKNMSFSSTQSLDVRSKFNDFLNMETGFKYGYSKFKEAKKPNQNIQSNFNLFVKANKNLDFSVNNDFYFNNIGTTSYNRYHFLDFNLKYKVNQRMNLALSGRNLTNNTTFKTNYLTQINTTTNSFQLLGTSILFDLSYRF